nr:uncharacterized RNA-binding protein C365.04c-like isoform X2 [Crassostrea virginica]
MSENKKSVVNRKDRRKSWWGEQKKKEKKRDGLRKSTLTVRPSMYTETKIITQEEDSKPRSQNHAKANRKKPKLSGDTKPSKSVKSKPPTKNPEPASEESPAPSPSKLLPQKYVLFVGNLPYSVTKEQLEEHFRKTGGVKAIRIPKEKGTGNCKGFAYVEFKDRISHGIALRLHHTTLGGRKINVEFTSHGSGKNDQRKEKLKLKNLKLAKMKVPLKGS